MDPDFLRKKLREFFPNAPLTAVRTAAEELSEESEFVVSNDSNRTQHMCVDADIKVISLSKKRGCLT